MTKLYSVKSGMTDLADSSALMILRIKGDVAAHEVDQLTDRVVRKKRAQAEAGECLDVCLDRPDSAGPLRDFLDRPPEVIIELNN